MAKPTKKNVVPRVFYRYFTCCVCKQKNSVAYYDRDKTIPIKKDPAYAQGGSEYGDIRYNTFCDECFSNIPEYAISDNTLKFIDKFKRVFESNELYNIWPDIYNDRIDHYYSSEYRTARIGQDNVEILPESVQIGQYLVQAKVYHESSIYIDDAVKKNVMLQYIKLFDELNNATKNGIMSYADAHIVINTSMTMGMTTSLRLHQSKSVVDLCQNIGLCIMKMKNDESSYPLQKYKLLIKDKLKAKSDVKNYIHKTIASIYEERVDALNQLRIGKETADIMAAKQIIIDKINALIPELQQCVDKHRIAYKSFMENNKVPSYMTDAKFYGSSDELRMILKVAREEIMSAVSKITVFEGYSKGFTKGYVFNIITSDDLKTFNLSVYGLTNSDVVSY